MPLNPLEVLSEIGNLQEDLPDLRWSRYHHAVYTGDLVPGCRLCLRRAWQVIHIGAACNLDCVFCPITAADRDMSLLGQSGPPSEPDRRERGLQSALEAIRAGRLDGVSLSGGEPLLHMDALEQVIATLLEAKPDLHLWLYTNGTLATEQKLRHLRDLGVSELRVNLAATRYAARTLGMLRLARSVFPHLVVEIAPYPPDRALLLGCLGDLHRIGIDQLNLQELVVTPGNINRVEGRVYELAGIRLLYGSRLLSYRVISECHRQKYGFTCVDCSAGIKRQLDMASPLGY